MPLTLGEWVLREHLNDVWNSILILLDLVGVWLVVRPTGPIQFWTAHRTPATALDRFTGRLVGFVILWTQISRWSYGARSENVRIALLWVLILFFVFGVAVLAYDFAKLFGPKSDRDEIKWRTIPAESEEETTARYRAAWRRYRRLRVAFPLVFFGWLPFGYILGTISRTFHWNYKIAAILAIVWIPLIPIIGWQWSFWRCPRCGHAFKGKYDLFFPRRCHYCKLPKWSESPNE